MCNFVSWKWSFLISRRVRWILEIFHSFQLVRLHFLLDLFKNVSDYSKINDWFSWKPSQSALSGRHSSWRSKTSLLTRWLIDGNGLPWRPLSHPLLGSSDLVLVNKKRETGEARPPVAVEELSWYLRRLFVAGDVPVTSSTLGKGLGQCGQKTHTK